MNGPTGLRLVPPTTGDDVVVTPVCPLCHTVDTTVTAESLRGGGYWRCTVCSQSWDARRLETAAAYADFAAARDGTRVGAVPRAA
jgi:hypothetical protein